MLQLAVIVIGCLCLASAGAAAEKLGSYKINKNAISVSGISSGAYMALQLHVANSGNVMGAGIIAGGPYYCAKGNVWDLLSCMYVNGYFNGPPDVSESIHTTIEEAGKNSIDDTKNLSKSRVWLFSGKKDTVVPTSVTKTVEEYYKAFIKDPDDIRMIINPYAAHAMISPYTHNRCGHSGPPFLNNCNGYSAAGELMQWIYREKFTGGGSASPEHLHEFDQTEFFDTTDESVSMHQVGHIYLPDNCVKKNGKGGCRLHIAFHGCLQSQDLIDDAFYAHAGYNEWAETNNIIILYPQATKWDPSFLQSFYTTGNPNGCWDWWGYSGSNYYVKKGKQMQAIRKMIERLEQ